MLAINLSAKKIIPFIVSLALFMEAVDTTIINTAIPAMARSLQVDPVDLKIALISYLLTLAIFIPISGWVADKLGIKRVFIAALIIFTVSSLWCGLANNLWELIIARSLQGIGGSLMLPVGRLILVRTFARHEYIATINRVVMVGGLGLMLGPVIGGFITHYISWHWILWVNIPVGCITIAFVMFCIKDEPPKKVHPLDKLGFVLFGAGLSTLTFGLTAMTETEVHHGVALSIILVAVILLMSYAWHSRSKRYPIVNTQLLHLRTFRVSVLGNLLCRFSFGGVPFLLPLFLQVALGYPAQVSGLLLAPMAFGVLLVKPFSLKLLRLFGYKRLLVLNTVLLSFSMWTFIGINSQTSIPIIACYTFIFGFFTSLQYSGMNTLAYADITPDDLSSATSIMSTMQQISQSFGVAVAAFLLSFYSADLSSRINLTPTVFHHTFFAMGFLTLISVTLFMRLKPNDGTTMIHPVPET